MKIPGRSIADAIKHELHEEVLKLKKQNVTPKLVTILIGDSAEQLSFVSIKEKTAHKLGIDFEFIHLQKVPNFQDFACMLKAYSANPNTNGIIIQQPLPMQLQTDSLYNYIPLPKEIEAHRPKSPFYPPIGLAVLTVMKYIYDKQEVGPHLIVDMKEDAKTLKKILKNKKIIVVGRGITGGQPVGKTLSELKINYLSINSRTFQPEEYYKDAEIIITAVGKKMLSPNMIKEGVVLLNIGLRREGEELKGDFDEDEVKQIAEHYTTTPGGVGPIDVLYLFKNLIDATKLQHNIQ
jgi:methylenetetrahydrofolate dehydrogenase (NADP+)/methenyltetrahydrofolate cyclohydrolase